MDMDVCYHYLTFFVPIGASPWVRRGMDHLSFQALSYSFIKTNSMALFPLMKRNTVN